MYKQYKKSIQIILSTVIVLVLALSSLPFAQPVWADTETETVAGEGSLIEGNYKGAPADWTGMNLNDDDTSYLGNDGTDSYHTYNFTDFTGIAASISDVALTGRIQTCSGYCYAKFVCRIGGVNYLSSQQSSTVWATKIVNWSTNPATGLAWTASAINAAEFGAYLHNDTGTDNAARLTYLSLTVTYTPLVAPTVTTSAATSISANTTHCFATMNGAITATGGENASQRGFAWGTTCNSTTPASTQAPPATYSTNWTEGGSFGTGTFSYTTNLTCCTTYCYRAYARNSVGWAWGNEITFVTMCNPSIQTLPATYVQATTARLNVLVIYDGEQACDVRFLYSTVSGNCTSATTCSTSTCNSTSYNGTTPWVNNTYTTGQTPYVDLSGLATSKTYYFCSQIRNDVGCRCGGQLSFTTSSGVNVPTNFKGIARPREISLFWIKGSGSTYTLVRGKIGSYPSSITDGTQVYLDTQTSVVWTGLTPGTTYYFIAWGKSDSVYSTSNITLMITTLGAAAGTDPMTTPPTPTQFYQSPDYTQMSNIPFYDLVNWWAESFEIPYNTLWLVVAILASIAAGIFTFWKSQKVFLSCVVVAVFTGLGSFMGLLPLWLIVPPLIISATSIALGERI